MTALMEAILAGDESAVAARATPEALRETDADGTTPLMLAARRGRRAVVELLLARGAPVDAADTRGYTALFHACLDPEEDRGHPEVVALLARAGANLEADIGYGVRPLMYAAGNGEAGVVEVLLAAGADPLARNTFGRTALMMVKDRDYVDVINLLHEAEAQREAAAGCGSRNAPDRQVVTSRKPPPRG